MADELLLISDIDSVLCQTAPRALRWAWDRYGVVVHCSAIVRYEIEYAIAAALRAAGIDRTPQEIDRELAAACWKNDKFYEGLAPRHEIWAAVFGWQRQGLPLQLMTRRSEPQRAATERWLVDHGIQAGGDSVIDGQPKLVLAAEKAALSALACTRYQRVIFLEDAQHHAEEIAAACPAEVLLVAQPWNVDTDITTNRRPGRIERLDDQAIARHLGTIAAAQK